MVPAKQDDEKLQCTPFSHFAPCLSEGLSLAKSIAPISPHQANLFRAVHLSCYS
jgi:hypothetical protein